jgi:uncharacterized protein (UPF0332 family)
MFEPLKWIAVADRLAASNDEADYRTAISRYYYGVFIQSLLSLQFDRLLEPTRSRSDHSLVVRTLRGSRRSQAAFALQRLAVLRELADYETESEVTRETANEAQMLAAAVVRACATDWERMSR